MTDPVFSSRAELEAKPSDPPPKVPTLIYVQWSNNGQNIRKWSHAPFEGGQMFALVSDKVWTSYQYDPGSYA